MQDRTRKIVGVVLLLVGVFTVFDGWNYVNMSLARLATMGGACDVTVLDEYGRPVEGAEIIFLGVEIAGHYYELNLPPITTDINGETSFAISLDGLFKLKAEKAGYAPDVQDVPIFGGGKACVTFTLTTAPDVDGTWSINGETVAAGSFVEVAAEDEIEFIFVETAGGVTEVKVELERVVKAGELFYDELYLIDEGSGYWTGSTTLLEAGTYDVTLLAGAPHDGLVTYVTIEVKSGYPLNLVSGGALMAVGAVLLADPEKMKDHLQ